MARGDAGRRAITSGYVLKLIRESLTLTQDGLALEAGVSPETIQGWESGRRHSLLSTSVGDFLALVRDLRRLSAPDGAIRSLYAALEADSVIECALTRTVGTGSLREHPLAAWAWTRQSGELLRWPLTGRRPPALAELPDRPRRGPVPALPTLTDGEKALFFDHYRGIANRSVGELAPDDPLGINLRHQAYSILGGDSSSYTWLVGASRHEGLARSRPPRSPLWLVDRALATALARQGDRDRLTHFIDRCLIGDDQEHANLRYWACWAGATLSNPALQIFDGGDLSPSVTARFLAAAPDCLSLGDPCVALNVHTLRSIIRRPTGRRTLLAMPEVCDLLLARGALLLDSNVLTPKARVELDELRTEIRIMVSQ